MTNTENEKIISQTVEISCAAARQNGIDRHTDFPKFMQSIYDKLRSFYEEAE